MAKQKAALGRGLGALIDSGDDDIQVQNQQRSDNSTVTPVNVNHEIEMDKIEANPFQPRMTFDDELLRELADSIEVHGVIQPITVRVKEDGRYQIISGERRFRAAKLAGLTSIPAYIRSANDQEMIEMALIENIQRDDLDAIEIAISYKRLIDECSLKHEEVAKRVGKDRSTVSNYLRLLELPADVQQHIRDRKLSMGHARAIVSAGNAKVQSEIAQYAVDEKISVRQIEEFVKKLNQPKPEKQKLKKEEPTELPENYSTLIELLEKYFDNKFNIKRNDKGEGSITITFKSDTEIEEFIKKLSK